MDSTRCHGTMADEPMDCDMGEQLQIGKDDEQRKYRGLAIIVSFNTFKNKKWNLQYMSSDIELLKDGFKALKYGVVVWDDKMDNKTFFYRLNCVSKNSLQSNCETFALVIVSHGGPNGILYSYDSTFTRQKVLNHFNSKNCHGLKNKTKLFIFNACRGDKHSGGVKASGSITQVNSLDVCAPGVLERENIILCSTFEGNVAYAHTKDKNSSFAIHLSSVMKTEGVKEEKDRRNILRLLTEVSRRIASENINHKLKILKQQPVLGHYITEVYRFKNKEEIPDKTLEDFSANKF